MTFNHLVLSGGGPVIFKLLGAIQYLQENQVWDMKDIKSIYATSSGAILGAILCLNFERNVVKDYVIGRPWKDAFKIDLQTLMNSYSKRGLFDRNFVEIFFKPLFDSKNISMDITLKEFFILTQIDFHVFSFEFNTFRVINISYITHPTLHLLTAIHMSIAIPIILCPVFLEDGGCYIDGGIICNYPLNQCIEEQKLKEETFKILGFKNDYQLSQDTYCVNEESTLMDYMMNFITKLVFNMSTECQQTKIESEVLLTQTTLMSISSIQDSLHSIETRKSLFQEGVDCGMKYFEKIN
jgi:predicted acylesterase/phospholipase RssA